jgi:uncharacterized protein (DUF2384 family)
MAMAVRAGSRFSIVTANGLRRRGNGNRDLTPEEYERTARKLQKNQRGVDAFGGKAEAEVERVVERSAGLL